MGSTPCVLLDIWFFDVSSYMTSLKICSQCSGILDWLMHIVDDSLPLSSFVQQDWATTGFPDESSKCKRSGKDGSKTKKSRKNDTNDDKPVRIVKRGA